MRQIVLDTETTGLDPKQGHRIIEIGCVEILNRRRTENEFHQFFQPDREIDAGAKEVHGISNEFLADKPRFGEVARAFLDFIKGAELIIHNAPFDVGFLDSELRRVDKGLGCIGDYCRVLDSLSMARDKHPGQKNSLDALCRRYQVDNSERTLHGALLDAEILADVYLAMTGGQASLDLDPAVEKDADPVSGIRRLPAVRAPIRVLRADAEELTSHEAYLDELEAGGRCLWRAAKMA